MRFPFLHCAPTLLLLGGLAAAGTDRFSPQEPPPSDEALEAVMRAARDRAKAEAAAKDKDRVPAPPTATSGQRSRVVFGQVVDGDDKPIAGVGVVLGSLKSLDTADCLRRPLATTNKDGRFEFVLAPPKQLPPGEKLRQVTKTAKRALLQVLSKGLAQAVKEGLTPPPDPNAEETETAKRAYLLACAEGWLSLRVKMPSISYAKVERWREAETAEEKAAAAGFDVMARIWGRAAEKPRDGIDLQKIVLHHGAKMIGRIVDRKGKPVAGARLTAKDLLTAGRFRGLSSRNNSKQFYESYARTAKDGSFELPGVYSTGSQLTVVAEGFFSFSEPVIGTDVKLELARAGRLAGKVVDQAGKPASGALQVRYEVASINHQEKVSSDGKFEFYLKYPHRFRLVVTPSGASASEHGVTYSPILSAARNDLVVTLEKKKEKPKKVKPPVKRRPNRRALAAKLGFPVTVVDDITGRPLSDFKANAIWVRANYNANQSYYEGRFTSGVKTSTQPGYIRLPGPGADNLEKGAVVIKAPGYAMFTELGLEFEASRLPRIDARLIPESILGGEVRDAVTNEPVAGARLSLYYYYPENKGSRSVSGTADKEGRFTFKELRAGRYRLTASFKNRPSKTINLELGAEEKRADLVLAIGHAAKVAGRVIGTKPGKGWQMELLSESNARSMMYNPGYRPSGPKCELKADGTFEFAEVRSGYYEVCLRIPRDPRSGTAMQIPLEPIRVRGRNLQIVVDASEDRPGALRGKISLTGAKIDLARLMVIADRFVPESPYNYYGYSNVDLTGARCQVGEDGSFSVDVASGEQQIKIIDVLTGVQFYKSQIPIDVDSGETVVENVELALTEVRVKLKPENEKGLVSAAWLNIEVEQPKPEAMRMFVVFGGYNGRRATGISLVGRDGVIDLVLPPYKTKFQVWSEVARLARTKAKPNSILGDAEIEPKLGEVNEVEVEVSVPETGFDPEPEESDEKAKDKTPKDEKPLPGAKK